MKQVCLNWDCFYRAEIQRPRKMLILILCLLFALLRYNLWYGWRNHGLLSTSCASYDDVRWFWQLFGTGSHYPVGYKSDVYASPLNPFCDSYRIWYCRYLKCFRSLLLRVIFGSYWLDLAQVMYTVMQIRFQRLNQISHLCNSWKKIGSTSMLIVAEEIPSQMNKETKTCLWPSSSQLSLSWFLDLSHSKIWVLNSLNSFNESLHKIGVLGQLIGSTDALGTWCFPQEQLCSLPLWEFLLVSFMAWKKIKSFHPSWMQLTSFECCF